MESGSFYATGVTFDDRQKTLEFLNKEMYTSATRREVFFELEDDNPYDHNAVNIKVKVDDECLSIGYVPKEINKDIREIINSNKLKKVKIFSVGRAGEGKPFGVKIRYEVEL